MLVIPGFFDRVVGLPPNGHIKSIFFLVLGLMGACEEAPQELSKPKMFQSIPSSVSGIDFQNRIEESESSNYYQYMYSYIGGGVAVADFNGDSLQDLFFVSNSFDNKLYLNQGDLKFLDYTEAAGIQKRPGFDAGVTVVDINADGLLDIYISRGGGNPAENRFANMLYINQGIGQTEEGVPGVTFSEMAESYGLADTNRSIHTTFFDYDKDGDLDAYIANSPDFLDRASDILDLKAIQTDPQTLAHKGSDKLYQNDGEGHFVDVSLQAGILPDMGFGLNPQVGDLNGDGWLDIYVCNDFRIPDFAYINQGNGTFREGRDDLVKHMSFNSMGSDIGDVNNDGLMDLFTLDMNPEDYIRSKTTMGMTPLDRFQEMVDKGYHYNYMHNMLQLNNGNGTFSELAQMAGVANTDWSWASLLADFDLDGFNDIYVTNGVFRDVIDRDANNAILMQLREKGRKPTPADFLAYTQMLPQQKLNNYFFRNKGDLTFENVSSAWTDSIPSFSNGAVYADLDNDGDLEVIVNNINTEATLLKNHSVESQAGHFLKVQLKGPPSNPNGVGTQVRLQQGDGSQQIRQLINARGFLSSVSNVLHFGLGDLEQIPSLTVIWPDGKTQELSDLASDKLISLSYSDAREPEILKETQSENTLFTKQNSPYFHEDPRFNDYDKQILLPHKLSQTGPAVAQTDVNGDGIPDMYLGGGRSHAGKLLMGRADGAYREKAQASFERDRMKEDVAAHFFDADQDGDQDLYVVSGSYEFQPNSRPLADRVYLNDGKGNFSASPTALPGISSAGSVVVSSDYDQDGDLDLFVGGRVIPGAYPYAPESYLLINKGGSFQMGNAQLAPELTQIGMVTDAVWKDMDGDSDVDLILTGEWMGIEVFVNESGRLERKEPYKELATMTGWWNKLLVEDVDGDGDQDIVAGNLGLNYKFHASLEKPFHVYTHDFDFNGTADVFLAKDYKGMEVPVRGKTCATQQVPHLANKIPSYNDFASRDLEGILGPSLKSALHYTAIEFRSGIFYNEGATFRFSPFPNTAQLSPINSMLYVDFDGDGIKDLLMAGNNHMSEIETTRADAGVGVFLKGNSTGEFTPISHQQSGFFAHRDVRNLIYRDHPKGARVWVINNNGPHEIFRVNSQPVSP